MKVMLKAARYEHTRGVVATAEALAEAYGLDVYAVRVAAWLHDAAKSLSPARQKSLAKQAGADAHELASPSLWHAAAGCTLAQKQFAIKDPAILQAIRFHTTGAPSLGPIAKVIYVADYSEPGRRYKGTKKLRKLALSDLEAAYRAVLREKLAWVVHKRQALHPRTVEAYNEAVQTAH
jgi:predicted HD superfamily hydrolase involved in NAD metabolism